MKNCIIGVGNVLRRDDGIGLEVVGQLRAGGQINDLDFFVIEGSLFLLPQLINEYDKVLIIDAVPPGPDPGRVIPLNWKREFWRSESYSLHDFDLLWQLNSALSGELDSRILVLGIETGSIAFGIGFSEAMKRAFPVLIREIMDYQKRFFR